MSRNPRQTWLLYTSDNSKPDPQISSVMATELTDYNLHNLSRLGGIKMSLDIIEIALDYLTGHAEFEKLAAEIMRDEGFSNILFRHPWVGH